MNEKEDNEANEPINNVLDNEEADNEKGTNNDAQKKQNEKSEYKNAECTIILGGDMMYAITFLGRLILTLYSFHGLFFIYNFIIQYIILVPGILYEIQSKFFQVVWGLCYLLFAICTSNILVIPTFEFFSFPFLTNKNPFAHLQSFYYIFEDQNFDTEKIVRQNNNYLNSFLIIVEILYSLGYILGLSSISVKVKDFVKIIILFLIYLYYLIIFLNYIIISFYFIFAIICFNEGKQSFFDIQNFFEKRKAIPEINLLSYVVNPQLLKNYDITEDMKKKKYCEDYIDSLMIIIRILLLIFSIVLVFFLDVTSIFFFIAFFFIMLGASIFMYFQNCFRNKKTFGHFWAPKYKYKPSMNRAKMVSTIRFFCFLISLFAASLLFYSFFFVSENDNIEDFPEFTGMGKKSDKALLLPSICSSSIHGIPIYLYLPFINDAYYYNSYPKEAPGYYSSLNIRDYKELFYDNNYQINIKGNLIKSNNSESVKMIQYNVKNSKDEVTILSIKGTSNKKDIYLDFQLYFPSILLNILSTFSIFGQQKDTLSFKFIEYSLSIPYRLFSQHSIIDDYLNDLIQAYAANQDSFYKNIVIVGHSLGGGLSKILGRLVKQQAISLSGPGVNAFHNLWGYEGQSENFEISAIDLVPDMDLVPRVEVSGGTIYRIVCKEGPLDCHSKVLSLCEILIMCRNPNYEEYCRKMANLNDKQINDIYKDSELN